MKDRKMKLVSGKWYMRKEGRQTVVLQPQDTHESWMPWEEIEAPELVRKALTLDMTVPKVGMVVVSICSGAQYKVEAVGSDYSVIRCDNELPIILHATSYDGCTVLSTPEKKR